MTYSLEISFNNYSQEWSIQVIDVGIKIIKFPILPNYHFYIQCDL